MTVYEYHPRNFGATPDPAAVVPANGSPEADLVGGETALDTSDGYTSYTRLQADGGGGLGAPTDFLGHVFTFEPVGAAAPALGITRVWWEMDYQHDAKVMDPITGNAANTALMWGYFGAFYLQVFGVGDWVAHSFGDPESQDLDPVFLSYAPTLIAGTFILGAGDPGYIDTVIVDVTRLTMFVEAGMPYLRQRNRDTARARNLASRQRGIRQRGYL